MAVTYAVKREWKDIVPYGNSRDIEREQCNVDRISEIDQNIFKHKNKEIRRLFHLQ